MTRTDRYLQAIEDARDKIDSFPLPDDVTSVLEIHWRPAVSRMEVILRPVLKAGEYRVDAA